VTTRSGFAYVQARIQARYGARPDDGVWRALDATRGLPAYLAEIRKSGLAPWVSAVGRGDGPHPIEHALRQRLHEAIDEIITWTPASWRPAVSWCHWLPELPTLGLLLTEGTPPTWLADDPRLRPYLRETASERRARLITARAGSLVEGWQAGTPVAAWLDAWRHLWPRGAASVRDPLEELTESLSAHLHDFPSYAVSDAWTARHALQHRVQRLFRRHPVQPVALFSYLALVCLDLERLRAGLVERAVFAPVEVAS
jgi:hypothetical protein